MLHHPSRCDLRRAAKQIAAIIGRGNNSQPVAIYRLDCNSGLLVIADDLLGMPQADGSILPKHVNPDNGSMPSFALRHT